MLTGATNVPAAFMQASLPDVASRLMGLVAVTFALLILMMLLWLKRKEVEEAETYKSNEKARSSRNERAEGNA